MGQEKPSKRQIFEIQARYCFTISEIFLTQWFYDYLVLLLVLLLVLFDALKACF